MAITRDVTTENIRTATTTPQTFSHAAASSGVKGVVLALVHDTSSTDHVSAASYGGVAMARLKRNVDTTGEQGAAELWFLGASVPQGTQTVSYTPGSTGDDFFASVTTLLAAADLESIDTDGISENAIDPSVTLQYGGRSAMAFAALFSGLGFVESFTPNANCTALNDHDFAGTSTIGHAFCQTTAGTADFAIGGSSGGNSDDVALAAAAISEVAGSSATATPGVGAISSGSVVSAIPPTLTKELKQNISLGSAVAAGQIPSLVKERAIQPGVGSAITEGRLPTIAPARTITPSVGLATTDGRAPTIVSTVVTVTPGVGLATIEGRASSVVSTVVTILPGVGLATTAGKVPTALGDGAFGPAQGLATIAGLIPGLSTELVNGVDVGLVTLIGLAPTLFQAVEATITPDVGLVIVEGRTPTASAEEPRGHVKTKRRGRSKIAYETPTLSHEPVVKLSYELTPQPAAYWDPPADAIAGIDTSQVESRLDELEARRMRRRREEEELIAILMRAA